MYIAAISSIDSEQYEAAKVDGANRFQCMWHITVPGILPTYFVLLLLTIASFINNGMEQYYLFENPMNKGSIEVLDLYVYNMGMVGPEYFLFNCGGSAEISGKCVLAVLCEWSVENFPQRINYIEIWNAQACNGGS